MPDKENPLPIDPEVLKSDGQPIPISYWISMATFLISISGQSLCYIAYNSPDIFGSIEFLLVYFDPTWMLGFLNLTVIGVVGFYTGTKAWVECGKKTALALIILNPLSVGWVLLVLAAMSLIG